MRNIAIIAALALLLGTVSCVKQEPDALPKEGGKTLTLKLVPDDLDIALSRGTLNENKIYNVVVMVFRPDDAQFTVKTAYINTGTNLLTIPNVATGEGVAGYTVYVAANVGMNTGTVNLYSTYFNFVGLESDVATHLRMVNSNLNLRTAVTATDDALIMSGNVTLTGNETEVTIPLKRHVAKVNYNITLDGANPALADYHIRNVRFGNIPGATYMWGHNDTDADLDDDEFIVSDFFYPAADGRSANGSVYLPENRRGTGGNRNSTTVNGAPQLATYLEFTLEDTDGKTSFYKVYLGDNDPTNYDVRRNCIYNVNVHVNGVGNIDSDVRIANLGDIWYETNGLLLHYDGIYNNGIDAPQVTNQTVKKVEDPYLMRWNATRFNYSPSYTRVETDYNATTAGAINRWKNISPNPATKDKYSMPLYGFTYNNLSGWGPDCLIFSDDASIKYAISSVSGTNPDLTAGKGTQCSMVYDDPVLRPQKFTIETVFLADPGKNIAGGGCDLYGFFIHPTDPTGRYVISGVEVYPTGMGFIAGGKWNGQNYAIGNMSGNKRRVVIQFDGVNLTAWYGEKIVYYEQKAYVGSLPWPTGPLGSTTTDLPAMLTFGKFYCSDINLNFSGRMYAFRFYDRVLSEAELHHNYLIDEYRFGIPKH